MISDCVVRSSMACFKPSLSQLFRFEAKVSHRATAYLSWLNLGVFDEYAFVFCVLSEIESNEWISWQISRTYKWIQRRWRDEKKTTTEMKVKWKIVKRIRLSTNFLDSQCAIVSNNEYFIFKYPANEECRTHLTKLMRCDSHQQSIRHIRDWWIDAVSNLLACNDISTMNRLLRSSMVTLSWNFSSWAD
jgi:hypothetical protein